MQKRRDVLRTYGSYPHPLLLLKALPEESVQIPYGDKLYPSEIRHAGGKPIAANSDAFYELKRWLDNDANRDGVAPMEVARQGVGSCNSDLPPPSRRPMADTSAPSYQTFVDVIHPILQQSCAFGTCHSSPQADFYLTCGGDAEQMAFNFGQAAGFVALMPAVVEQSELLLRPLSPQARRRQPHRRRVLQVARRTTPGRCCATGPKQVQRERRRTARWSRPRARRSSRST